MGKIYAKEWFFLLRWMIKNASMYSFVLQHVLILDIKRKKNSDLSV